MDYEFQVGDKVMIIKYGDGKLTNSKIIKEITKIYLSKNIELNGFGIFNPSQLELVEKHKELTMEFNFDASKYLKSISCLNETIDNYEDLIKIVKIIKKIESNPCVHYLINCELEKYEDLIKKVDENE